MKQCEICSNNKICHENNWVITMDRHRVFVNGDFVCDNFKTDKEIIILNRYNYKDLERS